MALMKCLRLTRLERLPDFAQKQTFVDGSVQTADFGPTFGGSLAFAPSPVQLFLQRPGGWSRKKGGAVEWHRYPGRGEYALLDVQPQNVAKPKHIEAT